MLCAACGGLAIILGSLFAVLYVVLRSYTSSLHYFETVPSYVASVSVNTSSHRLIHWLCSYNPLKFLQLIVTGLLMLCFGWRRNRFGYLVRNLFLFSFGPQRYYLIWHRPDLVAGRFLPGAQHTLLLLLLLHPIREDERNDRNKTKRFFLLISGIDPPVVRRDRWGKRARISTSEREKAQNKKTSLRGWLSTIYAWPTFLSFYFLPPPGELVWAHKNPPPPIRSHTQLVN